MPSAKSKDKGGAAAASPSSLTKNKLYTDAQAAIRKVYETSKPRGFRRYQSKMRDGGKLLEKLVVSLPDLPPPSLSNCDYIDMQSDVSNAHYDNFRDFCEWVEGDVR